MEPTSLLRAGQGGIRALPKDGGSRRCDGFTQSDVTASRSELNQRGDSQNRRFILEQHHPEACFLFAFHIWEVAVLPALPDPAHSGWTPMPDSKTGNSMAISYRHNDAW